MAINKSFPMRFTPRGLVDAFDATDRFQGACRQLTNLVFDPSNPELVVSRPGVTLLTNFALNGFLSPGYISVHAAIGTRIYGMIATSRNAGHDEPFCYDTSIGGFVTITGVTNGNTPTSPATSGDWTPPTIAAVGTMIVITHPGFNGTGANFYGIIDITTFTAPVWRDENTTTTALPAVPVAVANFNNRAWFALQNGSRAEMWYTNVLTNPLTITNATQSLVIGDNNPIIALSGLPIQTTSSGIVQSLTVFKPTQIWQITGDTVFNNLSQNYVSLTVGTNAPRSIAQSPFGLYFSSTGGPYVLDPLGNPRQLTHDGNGEPDIQAPFENAQTPTRWAAAYNSSVYRVCGTTVLRGVQQTNDYWFDEHKRRWNGPHSFAYDCASALAGYFVLSSPNFPGLLIRSNPVQDLSFVDTDLNTPYTITLLTSTFPKVGDMFMKQVAESQIELGSSAGLVTYLITAQDEQGNTLGTASIPVTSTGGVWNTNNWNDGTLWASSNLWGGGGIWGAPPIGSGGIWGAGSAQQIPHTYPVPWPAPLVFEKMALLITTAVAANAEIGTFYARYQRTGYMVVR